MLFTIADIVGLGDATIYFRLRNGAQYWDRTAESWAAAESADTKLFGTEYVSDTNYSNYEVTHTVPIGTWTYEAVNDSTGEVLGRDVTAQEVTPDISLRCGKDGGKSDEGISGT